MKARHVRMFGYFQLNAFRLLGRVLLGCLLLSGSLKAQYNGFPLRNYLPKEYNGFTQNWICLQDNRGILYFGNSSEILEYDGVSWKHIPVVKGVAVRSLCMDDKGVIYVGTVGDFGYLKPDANGNLHYCSLLSSVAGKGKEFSDVWKIFYLNDQVLFQTCEQIFVYKDKKITKISPRNTFSSLSFVSSNMFYVRERKAGLEKLVGNQFQLVTKGDTFADMAIISIVPYGKDKQLILTGENGFYLLDDAHHSLEHLNVPAETQLTNMGVLGMSWINDSLLSINTRKGLAFLSKQLVPFKYITKADGLNDESIAHVFVDRQNEYWLSTNNGISKVSFNSPVYYYDERNGYQGNIQAIYVHQNKLYAGTTIGMYVADLTDLNTPTMPHALEFKKISGTDFEVWNFHAVGNKLYAASSDGAYEINGLTARRISKYYTNDIGDAGDGSSELYLSQKGGVAILHPESDGSYLEEHFFDLGADDILTSCMFNDELLKPGTKALWLTTRNTGFIKLVFDADFHPTEKRYSRFNDRIQEQVAIVPYNNQLYFCSSKGGFRYDAKLDAANQDCFVPGQLPYFPKENRGVHISYWDSTSAIGKKAQLGIRGLKDVPYTYFQSNDRILWLGLTSEIVRFDGSIDKNYLENFDCYVRQVRVGKDSLLFCGSFLGVEGNDTLVSPQQLPETTPVIAYQYNSIRFQFAAPYFTNEDQTRYSYRLEGFDENWSEWSLQTTKEYTNLNEGHYVFQVKAENIYGKISSTGSFEFSILPPWYRTVWAVICYILLLIIFVWLLVRLSVRRLRKAKEKLERIVEERTVEVVHQKEELQQKNEVIEMAFNDIKASINYAKRIQESILPMLSDIEDAFPDSFVLFRPRDVVSGDFYWFSRHKTTSVIACVDCTGHGVPGAFMSMIGNTLLNQIVNEKGILTPSEILQLLNERIRHSLKQNLENVETKDGMDIAICTYDTQTRELNYAGANRPLYIVHAAELKEIKADKHSIGGDQNDNEKKFTNHTILLKTGSTIYLSSDGYADQFGGPKGKKFMVKQFQASLLKLQYLALKDQGIELNKILEQWKGEVEQVDDILVIGFKVT